MEFHKFMSRVDRMKQDNPILRWGQCLGNLLYEINPVLHTAMENEGKSPFYKEHKTDPKCKEAIAFLAEKWYT